MRAISASEFAVTVALHHASGASEPITINVMLDADDRNRAFVNRDFAPLVGVIERYTPYRFLIVQVIFLWDLDNSGMIVSYTDSHVLLDTEVSAERAKFSPITGSKSWAEDEDLEVDYTLDDVRDIVIHDDEHVCGHPCGMAGYCLWQD